MENKILRLQERLNVFAEIYQRWAEGLKEKDPMRSTRYFQEAELFKTASAEVVQLEPTEPEIEGDPHTWFYVCGECHTPVNTIDRFCRQCGRPLKWERMTSGKAQD